MLRQATFLPFGWRAATGYALFEWVHSWIGGGFPWLFVAHSQHAFLPYRSAHEAVVAIIERCWRRRLDDKVSSVLALLDVKNAYDVLKSKHLRHKLQRFGIHGKTLKWLVAFAKNQIGRASCRERV